MEYILFFRKNEGYGQPEICGETKAIERMRGKKMWFAGRRNGRKVMMEVAGEAGTELLRMEKREQYLKKCASEACVSLISLDEIPEGEIAEEEGVPGERGLFWAEREKALAETYRFLDEESKRIVRYLASENRVSEEKMASEMGMTRGVFRRRKEKMLLFFRHELEKRGFDSAGI